jgi:hypothetical protein
LIVGASRALAGGGAAKNLLPRVRRCDIHIEQLALTVTGRAPTGANAHDLRAAARGFRSAASIHSWVQVTGSGGAEVRHSSIERPDYPSSMSSLGRAPAAHVSRCIGGPGSDPSLFPAFDERVGWSCGTGPVMLATRCFSHSDGV